MSEMLLKILNGVKAKLQNYKTERNQIELSFAITHSCEIFIIDGGAGLAYPPTVGLGKQCWPTC